MNTFIRTLLFGLLLIIAGIAPGYALPVTFVYPDAPAGAVDKGFHDPTLGATRKAAFQAAANYFAANLSGTVPLVISAEFTAQGGTATSAVLAYAGPTDYAMNWSDPPAPHWNTRYPIGLANQLAGRDLDDTVTDIQAVFNSDVDGPDVLGNRGFYYGTDGNSGSDIDFYSVALHELGHGLGFLSNQASDGTYYGSNPGAYDLFLKRGALSLSTATAFDRKAAAISGALVFDGPFANAGNGGSPAKIYAPDPYEGGSSVSHVDEATYSGPNELMTPASSGVAHRLGPVAMGIFRDIGWTVADPSDPDQSGSSLVVNTTEDHDDSSCSTSDCTLREAINQANYLSGTQTITFNLGAGDKQLSPVSSLPLIRQPLVIEGPTDRKVTINGGLFYCYTSALTVKNLTMQGGEEGYSVYTPIVNSTVTLTNCTFKGHAGNAVSAVANGSSIVATNCTFSNNTASPLRTAVLGSNSITVASCTFSGNTSSTRGGAIYLLNQAGTGTLNVSGSTFSNNSAVDYGGAIYANCVEPNSAAEPPSAVNVTVSSSTFNGNTSNWGGGFFLWPTAGTASGSVSNCTFSGNSATSYGGGIANVAGVLGIDSVTFVGNFANQGAAVSSFNPGSSFTSANSLYSGNASGDGTGSLYAINTVASQGYNIFSDSPAGFTATGDRKNQSTLAGTLGPLENNGGPTKTHALLTGNPAINTGSTSLSVDQRGQARPQGSADDSGAYEAPVPSTPPTISAIGDLTIDEDHNTGDLAFVIGDAETPAAELTLTGSSNNTGPIPNAGITFGGSGANRTVKVTPAANRDGTAIITITVSDGTLTASTNFVLTVTPVNDPPTISDITNKSTPQGTSTGAIAFTVGDIDSSVPPLTLSGASSNTTLVPEANIVFGGSGFNRTVTVNPAAGRFGTATITVTVRDEGGATATDSFVLTVIAAPVITSFTPGIGPVGTDVVITGTGFTGATTVRFNGVDAAFTVNSATQITATVPAGATTGAISVVAPGGTGASATPFTVGIADITAPTVTITTPANGLFIK